MAHPKKRPLPQRASEQTSTPGYPSLREHLTSRRELLTFVGASLAGGVLSACFQTTSGMAPNPQYHTFRLPASGELETTLASGEQVQFYVNGVYYGDTIMDTSAAESLCLDVMELQTATALATTDGLDAAETELFQELSPLVDLLDSVTLTVVSP